MTKRLFLILPAALALGACAHKPSPRPLPPVTVTGPVFAPATFDLPPPPLPPDPVAAGKRAGSAAARYEAGLRASDRVCRARLGSVGRQLDAAGLVVKGAAQ
jgi:hypothetical protein